jgi:hypothetical protein
MPFPSEIGLVVIGGIVFPHPGEYRFQVYVSGDLAMERSVVCRQIEIEEREHGSAGQ